MPQAQEKLSLILFPLVPLVSHIFFLLFFLVYSGVLEETDDGQIEREKEQER